MTMLAARHAVLIGIDAYGTGIAPLQSAVADARAVADALKRDHGYASPHLLLDGEATGAAILHVLEKTLPAACEAESAMVVYYAGHGHALGDGHEGPEGFLLPHDARPREESTWLSMDRVRKALSHLPCKHLLVVLDCCFAGSFRWASRRSFVPVGRPLYDSQYDRFLAGTAWQVLTSASHQQFAWDEAPGCRNTRDDQVSQSHSPFAAALLQGLAGEADSSRGPHEPDGVITATELHQFIFEEMVPLGTRSRQTPGLWPLAPENTGEFLFLVPGREKKTRPDPPLDDNNNPWLGLYAYGSEDVSLFFGRERVVEEIVERLLDPDCPPLLAVVGASGTGKSSVVRAGVLPRLEKPSEELAGKIGAWTVARLPRLQGDPHPLLDAALQVEVPPGSRKLLFIDQFEELYTQCPDGEIRERFLQRLRDLINKADDPLEVVITLRSDFESRLAESKELGPLLASSRYPVPAMTLEELRDVIEEPAKLKALYFEPEALVGELLDEVKAMPGELPLLSFALAEMYRQAWLRRRKTGANDRALTRADYVAAGKVVGALHRRATELYEAAGSERQKTIRLLFLRMVSQEGGRLARRRVEERELKYPDVEEQKQVDTVQADYVAARLLVVGEGYVEPAHDTLVLAWEKLLDWLAEAGSQELVRQLWGAASAWDAARQENGEKEATGLLWNQDPRLPLVQNRYLGKRRPWYHRLLGAVRGWKLAELKALDAPQQPGELNRIEREFSEKSAERRSRRRNQITGITAGVILALSAVTWFALDRAAEERRARERAQDIARVAVAGQWKERDLTLAALVMLEVAKPDQTAYAVDRMREALETRVAAAVLRHPGKVESAIFSPDGKRVVTTSDDNTARVWAVDGSGEPVVLRGHEGLVWSAAFSPDSKSVVTASVDRTARVWAVDGIGEPVVLHGHDGPVVSAAFSPDGKRVVTDSWDGTARVWASDSSGGHVILRGRHYPRNAERSRASAAFSPDGKRVVTAVGTTARVWAADGTGEPMVLRGHEGDVVSASFSPDGKHVVTASEDRTARVWAADGSGEPVVLSGHEGSVVSAAFSSDGKHVVTASEDNTARVWAADGSHEPVAISGYNRWASSPAFSPDGKRVIIASDDNTARVWSAYGSGGELMVIRGHESSVMSAAFSPDGKYVVTASNDQTARVWAVDGSSEPVMLRGHKDRVRSAAFSPDGTFVVTASWDHTARVWSADGTGEPVVLRGHEDEMVSAVWSPDGKRVATASADQTARVWSADGTGEPVVLRGHEGSVWSAAFSPDGRLVVTASYDKTARVWSADDTGEPVVLRGHKESLSSATFSPDGKRVVTASADRTARVWSADGTGEPVVLRGHEGPVLSAAFSPDGKRVVTASDDRTARVWAADGTGEPVILQGHEETVESAAFSPDGWRVVTASRDRTARVWEADGSGEAVVLQGHGQVVQGHEQVDRLFLAFNKALSATFSPGGERVVTASEDRTARVWTADGPGEPMVLRGHEGALQSAAYSPDGESIVSASNDRTARVWAVGGTLLQTLIRKATNECLEPEFRVNHLGETKEDATATYERCRRCVGPWHRKFDQRAIRADPDKAWSEWQECMSGSG